eukprot:EG_transcript_49220
MCCCYGAGTPLQQRASGADEAPSLPSPAIPGPGCGGERPGNVTHQVQGIPMQSWGQRHESKSAEAQPWPAVHEKQPLIPKTQQQGNERMTASKRGPCCSLPCKTVH